MKRRIFLCILVFSLLTTPALAKSDYIRWVDFDVDYSAMQRALELDIASQGEEPPLCWIDLLALAATRCGDKGMKVSDIDRAAKDLRKNRSPEELLGEQFKYYSYYHEAYHAALGGLLRGGIQLLVPLAQQGTLPLLKIFRRHILFLPWDV